MKLSTFAVIITILAAAFGLAFILIPAQVATFYGLSQDTAGLWMSRYFGASLLFIAMIYCTGHTAVFRRPQNHGPNC